MDHLTSDGLINIMNTKYFDDFEFFFENNQWWIDKKARIYRTFEESCSENSSIRAQAKAQVMVRLRHIFILKILSHFFRLIAEYS